MKIKILKLTNNLDILCEVVSESEKYLTIRNPIRVITIPNRQEPNKPPTVGFGPWAEYTTDDTFQIDKSHIVVIMNPVGEFIDQYNSIFSKIIIPSASGQTPGGLILP